MLIKPDLGLANFDGVGMYDEPLSAFNVCALPNIVSKLDTDQPEPVIVVNEFLNADSRFP